MWTPESYKRYKLQQQPSWPDRQAVESVINQLRHLPALVFSGETRKLRRHLKDVNAGRAFILQVGNCSESFADCHGPLIHNYLRIVLQMALVLSFKTDREIIKVGRVAGQYAKPRSTDTESVMGLELPSYRGDIINSYEANTIARTPDPTRMLEGYFRSAATLNLIRAFEQGGYTGIENLHDWKRHFFGHTVENNDYYKKLEIELNSSLLSFKPEELSSFNQDQIYISHEALLLEYEEAFTRLDTTASGFYCTSAHTVWVGERTRQLDSAHIEYVSGINNPVGIKVGANYDDDELTRVLSKINPTNSDDKVILITRMGANKIATQLPKLIRVLRQRGINVIFSCDPMHGNTFSHGSYKVRSFDEIKSEARNFFEICRSEGAIPGGIHLEISSENVSECIGGVTGLDVSRLGENYRSKVDPRLNAAQSIEFAFFLAELIERDNDIRRAA